MLFENIIGNENIKQNLIKIAQNKNSSHSYLFLGQEGIGKILFAKEFAKLLLCETNNCCDNCKSCITYNSKNHPDFKIINEESEVIKINTIRELVEKVIEKPIISEKKIYIINDCDKMTKEAQNCLLKTLEEPPEYACIILVCSNENNLLNTIKSRCTKIVFNKLSNTEILEYFRKNNISNISEDMFIFFEGSIGRAKKVIANMKLYQSINNLIESLETKDKLDFYLDGKFLYNKDEIFGILEYIIIDLYNKGIHNLRYLNGIKIVNETIKKLNSNSNFDMCVDNMLFELWEEVNEKSNRR